MEQGSDHLATLLFQISSPAHIPWGDQRWQEVLHGYDVWVHMDDNNPLVEQARRSMTKHAELSSNLAALSLHVTRMLRDLVNEIRVLESEPQAGRQPRNNCADNEGEDLTADFSKRISIVAKARATAGALQLLRLLCHPVIVEASKDPDISMDSIKEAFIYHTRGDLATDQPAAFPLMHSLLDLIATLGTRRVKSTITAAKPNLDVLRIPEIYDAAIFSFHLFFVLFGTQLYQPFYSSFENSSSSHYFINELFRQTDDDNNLTKEDEATYYYNSQILWPSNRSVGSNSTRSFVRGSKPRSKRNSQPKVKGNKPSRWKIWTPKTILETCFEWQLHRPPAPERSIAYYYYVLAQSAVDAKGGGKPGQDGLYENYKVVQATSPSSDNLPSVNSTNENTFNQIKRKKIDNDVRQSWGDDRKFATRKSLIVDTTRGILTFSESIIFLPIRLLNLVYGVFTANNKHGSHGVNRDKTMRRLTTSQYSRTRDVLWLSDSLLADLACSMLLFLVSNCRNGEQSNAFRNVLKNLTDNRWDPGNGEPNLPYSVNYASKEDENISLQVEKLRMAGQTEKQPLSQNQQQRVVTLSGTNIESHLTLNFESLFVTFCRTLHNELGALLLYTIMQSSPSFAESLTVRSDMDDLVMPLIRTLYFAFRSQTFMAKDYGTRRCTSTISKGASGSTTIDIRDCPFRSLSQLYVIIILLLLFSQDSSFGRDVFRRITVVTVPWYKERSLKCINLGSVIILTLLRCLVFNLNRLSDVFLLNNCCAVLENLSPSAVDLHEYAAMRLVSVTVLVMKKHVKLVEAMRTSKNLSSVKDEMTGQELQRTEDQKDEYDNKSNSINMYSEVTHTLLGVIKHGLAATNIEGNAHLIYALVYHEADFLRICKTKYNVKKNSKTDIKKLYSSKQIARITSIIIKASELIQEEGARSAPEVLKVIKLQMSVLKSVTKTTDHEMTNKWKRKQNKHYRSNDKDATIHYSISHDDDGHDDGGGFTSNDISQMSCIATTEKEFTYLYEEESDPEVFFVPYIWDLLVSVVTAGTMEWKKDEIKVFPLLDDVSEQHSTIDFDAPTSTGNFSLNADEMV